MSRFVKAGLIVGATLSAAATGAQALEVSQVQLAIVASEKIDCPRPVTLKARALTDGPGTVKFVIRKAGGGKSEELSAQSVKGPDGKYSATCTQQFSIPKNETTKYMAEVVGAGKISPWVDFDETCGPQPRKETKTTGAPPRKGKHISELDKDPKPDGKPIPSGDGKPLPSGEGKPLPGGGGKPIAECKPTVTAKRVAAVTKAGGIASAWIAWSAGVEKTYGVSYSSVFDAKDKKSDCNWLGTYTCTVSAKPCHSLDAI
jgi:hypothetical protein